MASDKIILGQPFIIWGKPENPADPEEMKRVVQQVFETSRQIQHALPWCSFRYDNDPETGAPIIIGVPHMSGAEMVFASVSESLASVITCLASSITILNAPTASFQMNSMMSDLHKVKREEESSASTSH
jgi:hypothetical protein